MSKFRRARAEDEIQKAWQQHPSGIQGKCLVCGNRNPEYPWMLKLHHDPPKGSGGSVFVWKADLWEERRLVPLCPKCHADQKVVNGLREDKILPRNRWRTDG